jgi:hypothetical protein
MDSIEIRFGALCPPICEQIEAQGLVAREWLEIKAIQADADAVARLLVRGLISNLQARVARKRIVEAVTRAIKEGE